MSNKARNNIEALNNAMDLALGSDDKVVLYGEDVGFEGGVFRATAGLQKKYGEQRVWDSPIAEAALVGTAIGAALGGLKPIVEIQFDGFSFPGYMHLFAHAARYRGRTRQQRHVPMVLRIPMGGGIKALEHHSEALEAIFAHVPGLKVVYPSNPYDMKGLFLAAVADPDPVVFLEPKKTYRAFKQEIPDEAYTVEIGQANIIQEGKKLTLVTFGSPVIDCYNWIQAYGEDAVELIDLRTISPWDKETVLESVRKTGRLLVVHEAVKSFSVSAEIIASVVEAGITLHKPPVRVTGWDISIPLAKAEHIQFKLEDRVNDAIKELLA
ncbi:alpha-ketoacid dehydrogenase subunit beta [[Mycoplasma] testudinis]|uniref:alpha-ketoacid dehydrogenase subunit beta n=1 Tax=[Mycoplasma] testudinis TaxID=33924 RepID=UPI00048045C9|nr:alpha-ketoacid dehydrogenase subunit beta [[Mycoplasma] testudinis]